MADERINELLKNETFFNKLSECDSIDDTQKTFAEAGIELSLDDTKEILSSLEKAYHKAESDELDEQSLENVAGGAINIGLKSLLTAMWSAFKKGMKAGDRYYDFEKWLADYLSGKLKKK